MFITALTFLLAALGLLALAGTAWIVAHLGRRWRAYRRLAACRRAELFDPVAAPGTPHLRAPGLEFEPLRNLHRR